MTRMAPAVPCPWPRRSHEAYYTCTWVSKSLGAHMRPGSIDPNQESFIHRPTLITSSSFTCGGIYIRCSLSSLRVLHTLYTMEGNNTSTSQNNVNDTDPEAQVGPGRQVEQDAGIVSAAWPCTSGNTHQRFQPTVPAAACFHQRRWISTPPGTHWRESSTPAIVQNFSSTCTPRPQKMETTRWSIIG
jgi:hypothetical protein